MALISSDTHVRLVVNELTEAQYFQLSAQGRLRDNQLYMTDSGSSGGYDVGPILDSINGEIIDGLYFKADRIGSTKAALSGIIAENGETVPDVFHDYPQTIRKIISDLKGGSGPIDSAVMTLEYTTKNWFPDTSFTPTVTVSKDGIVLVGGTDYTLSYSDNQAPGTASVTAIAIGSKYTGQQTANFTLSKCNIASLPSGWRLAVDYYPLEFSTDGRDAYEPVINGVYLVNDAEKLVKTLTLNTDYTVGFVQNTGIGTGKVVITGTGNYEGEDQSAQFVIHNPAYSFSDFQSKLEQNLVQKNDCVIAKYVKNDEGYDTVASFKSAVDSSAVTVSDLEFIVVDVNATPPYEVMYKSSDVNFSKAWISIEDLMTASGIAAVPVGKKLLSRAWDNAVMDFTYAETDRTVAVVGSSSFSYAGDSAWSVPLSFTDSDGVTWQFYGYTATARAKWLIEANGTGVTAQCGADSAVQFPIEWLNSRYGSAEREQKPDTGIASSNGFILKLYPGMDFVKMAANAAYLRLAPALDGHQLQLKKQRFTLMSNYEAGGSEDDGISRYYSDKAGRVQHTEDGASHEMWLRSASSEVTGGQNWYGVDQYGEIRADWLSTKNAYVLPICTIASSQEYTPTPLSTIQYTALDGTGSTSGKISVAVTEPASGATIEYSLDQVSWTTTNPTITRSSSAGQTKQTVYFRITADGYKTVTGNKTVTLTVYEYVDDVTITGFSISSNAGLKVANTGTNLISLKDASGPSSIKMYTNKGVTVTYTWDGHQAYTTDQNVPFSDLRTFSKKVVASAFAPLDVCPDYTAVYRDGYVYHCLVGYPSVSETPSSFAVALTDVQ